MTTSCNNKLLELTINLYNTYNIETDVLRFEITVKDGPLLDREKNKILMVRDETAKPCRKSN
jgi:hypothetical protein